MSLTGLTSHVPRWGIDWLGKALIKQLIADFAQVVVILLLVLRKNAMLLREDIKKRVFEAADQLYGEKGGGVFPTVEEVRQRCRVGMASVNAAMKEWRTNQLQNPMRIDVEACQMELEALKTRLDRLDDRQELLHQQLEAIRQALAAPLQDERK